MLCNSMFTRGVAGVQKNKRTVRSRVEPMPCVLSVTLALLASFSVRDIVKIPHTRCGLQAPPALRRASRDSSYDSPRVQMVEVKSGWSVSVQQPPAIMSREELCALAFIVDEDGHVCVTQTTARSCLTRATAASSRTPMICVFL